MPKFYVKNDKGLWNVWSTICDGFIFDNFIPFEVLCQKMIEETIQSRIEELNSLLTDRPCLNIMSFEECKERISILDPEQQKEAYDVINHDDNTPVIK